jgi:HPt (histidine-containing phosphotransfer) domain-containing protein
MNCLIGRIITKIAGNFQGGHPAPPEWYDATMREKGTQPIDMAGAMARFDGDLPLYRELLHEFLSEAPERIRMIEEASARRDGERLREIAHGIRGAAGTLGADAASAIARAIEETGSVGEGSAVRLEALRAEIARIERYAGAIR